MQRSFFARVDSNSANNPALNLTGDPAIQLTFIDQTPGGGAGDLQLEQNGGSADPDTVVEIGGSTYSFTFELAGTLPTAKKDGAQQVPDQFEGDAVYIVTVHDYPTAGDATRYAFLPESGATRTEMDAFGNGAIDIQGATTTPPDSPICFLDGTAIATPGGEAAVETLRPGDLVLTRSGRARRILWTGRSEFVWPGAQDRHKPVQIAAGALDGVLPRRALAVSPQHRILMQGADVAAAFGAPRVLAPAIGLTGLPGIRRMRGRKRAVYRHLLLASHDLVLAEGLAAESLYPGPMALAALDCTQAAALRFVLPRSGYGPLAERAVSRRAIEAFIAAGALPRAA